jgi:hypothetical protein
MIDHGVEFTVRYENDGKPLNDRDFADIHNAISEVLNQFPGISLVLETKTVQR